jgi:hypothetical protein
MLADVLAGQMRKVVPRPVPVAEVAVVDALHPRRHPGDARFGKVQTEIGKAIKNAEQDQLHDRPLYVGAAAQGAYCRDIVEVALR